MFEIYVVFGLRSRGVSAIEGALIHTGIGSCIREFINCPCTLGQCSGASLAFGLHE